MTQLPYLKALSVFPPSTGEDKTCHTRPLPVHVALKLGEEAKWNPRGQSCDLILLQEYRFRPQAPQIIYEHNQNKSISSKCFAPHLTSDPKEFGGLGYNSVVEHLPSMPRSSVRSLAPKKEKIKKKDSKRNWYQHRNVDFSKCSMFVSL
jgi:hypothetical protein